MSSQQPSGPSTSHLVSNLAFMVSISHEMGTSCTQSSSPSAAGRKPGCTADTSSERRDASPSQVGGHSSSTCNRWQHRLRNVMPGSLSKILQQAAACNWAADPLWEAYLLLLLFPDADQAEGHAQRAQHVHHSCILALQHGRHILKGKAAKQAMRGAVH